MINTYVTLTLKFHRECRVLIQVYFDKKMSSDPMRASYPGPSEHDLLINDSHEDLEQIRELENFALGTDTEQRPKHEESTYSLKEIDVGSQKSGRGNSKLRQLLDNISLQESSTKPPKIHTDLPKPPPQRLS